MMKEIKLINYEEFEIDYEKKRLKFFSFPYFENLKSIEEFINWLLSNYEPSSFSFT